ncbi:entericidin EcnA/B family protein [Acidimangrovimonas pyrenivorans]|uniref:Entericidin EcnA/B family protein n=1 Tax=Acidimangrovimonas pyrenivorans TaxID=2030798 RepID=A0ABV7AFG6_9RHOB
MKKTLLLVCLLGLAACNTVDGIGRDISGTAQRVGSWF